MLTLTNSEKAMLDGRDGKARQKAMELLVRYAEALGAERFVDTRNVAGVPGSANPFLQRYYAGKDADGLDAIFSYFDLDSDELVEVPDAIVPTYHLQGGADPRQWQTLGVKVEVFRNYQEREAFAARHDVTILKTCTPYLAGNLPAKGEHCAWMESSAVIFANSVLGARTNTEGRESTSAAMLTGKIPDWGLHRTECRLGTHRVDRDPRAKPRELGHHREHPAQLLLLGRPLGAGAGGLTAHVEQVGALLEQPQAVGHRVGRLEPLAAVAEGVGGHVDHAHHQGAHANTLVSRRSEGQVRNASASSAARATRGRSAVCG